MTAPSDFNSISELDATLVFRVAYDGSSYSGFAEQPGQTTVAGELRRAIETLLRRPIDLTCAGRTDAGVHATGQVVHFDTPFTAVELTDAPGEYDLSSFSWDDTPAAPAGGEARKKADDDFGSLFGETDDAAVKK